MTGNMIAAVILTVFACALALLLVQSIGTAVMQKLKKEVFSYIKVYNKHLKEETGSDTEVSGKETAVEKTLEEKRMPADPAIPFIAKSEPIQKKDFFSDYLVIRSAFCHNAVQALQRLPKQTEEEREYVLCVNNILEKLSFEVMYRLSCLKPEQQLSVLEEILTSMERTILARYVQEQREVFDITAFHLFLKEQSKAFDATIYVYARNPESLGIKETPERLRLCEDTKLCEGFYIVQGNRLYDYGVRSSEITL